MDRYDSSIGYIETNCKTCCTDCNMMKKNYKYEEFIDKCTLIHKKNITDMKIKQSIQDIPVVETIPVKIIPDKDTQEVNIITPSNKLTLEQKREKERVKKQAQREALRNKYGDEQYKKLHAEKISEQRKKKREATP